MNNLSTGKKRRRAARVRSGAEPLINAPDFFQYFGMVEIVLINHIDFAHHAHPLHWKRHQTAVGSLLAAGAVGDDGHAQIGGHQLLDGVDVVHLQAHVETVVLLSKLNTKQHIEVELNLDELDLTDAEKKATYQEIKDYVLEHSGLKVSSLYIAQVKQKCGIIERENYNKPKSENVKQPQCPPEKEKAIKEALKHFGMV